MLSLLAMFSLSNLFLQAAFLLQPIHVCFMNLMPSSLNQIVCTLNVSRKGVFTTTHASFCSSLSLKKNYIWKCTIKLPASIGSIILFSKWILFRAIENKKYILGNNTCNCCINIFNQKQQAEVRAGHKVLFVVKEVAKLAHHACWKKSWKSICLNY